MNILLGWPTRQSAESLLTLPSTLPTMHAQGLSLNVLSRPLIIIMIGSQVPTHQPLPDKPLDHRDHLIHRAAVPDILASRELGHIAGKCFALM